MAGLWLRAAAAAGASGLAGCAIAYTDAAETRHVLGLVDMAVGPGAGADVAGDVVVISTLGLAFVSMPERTSVGLGYQRISIAGFRDNAVAAGPFDAVALAEPAPATGGRR